MRRSLSVKALGCAAGLAMAVSGLLATSSASAGTTAKASAAGPPAPTSILLCGNFTPGTDRFSGSSDIDHPSGSSAMGMEYQYTGQNCETNNGSSIGTFTWTISHSNVNVVTELGTEHGIANLSTPDGSFPAGFNGRITNFDFGSAPDPCGNRQIYYASGHQFDPTTCSPSAPGNFNTHGGAATDNHFNGKYGTVVYQLNNNPTSSCAASGPNYCFQAIIVGQTN